MILVSSCLAGINCKYNGGNNLSEKIRDIALVGEAILVCPEQLGGLPTPRDPAEIIGNKVITVKGEDVTEKFKKGVEEVIKISEMYNINRAILKSRSPSCGCGNIYDGTFSGKIIPGDGLLTKALKEKGIEVISDEDL